MTAASGRYRPFVFALVAGLAVTVLFGVERSTGCGALPLVSSLEQDLLDLRFRVRGPLPPGPEVVIVAVDERTLDEDPELFERRKGWADIVRAVHRAGAKVIVADALFAKPERILPPDLLLAIEAAVNEEGLSHHHRRLFARVARLARGDDDLAQAIAEAGNVILGFHFGASGSLVESYQTLQKGTYGQVIPGPELPPGGERVLASLPAFYDVAHAAGLVTTYEDPVSARVWTLPLARRAGPSVFAPIAVMAVAAFEGVHQGQVAFVGVDGSAHVGGRRIPSEHGDLLINHRGPPKTTFPTFSAADVIAGRVEAGALDGKLVLVGLTDITQDTASTPFHPRVPGVEVHAAAIDSILRGDVLVRTSVALDIVVVALFALLVALWFLPFRLSPLARTLGLLGLAVTTLAGAQVAFLVGPFWAPAAAPLLAVGLGGVVGLVAAYLEEGVTRLRMRTTFARYLSGELLDELVKDPSRASLQGERRRLSVLFTDIRSFTTFAETMEPLELAAFLNRFFSPMSAAVLEHRGFLDKYIGDAIMAVFGAPLPRTTHAVDACRCVLAMYEALLALRVTAKLRGIDLDMGAGINTGDVVVGNLGSEQRFDYTVVGDAVNLASRIEGLTKKYGVFCLVGEATRAEAAHDPAFVFRPIDLVRVKGKQQPEEIFELCVRPFDGLPVWAEAVGAWRAGRLDEAEEAFRAFTARNPEDKVGPIYLDRIAKLAGQAPAGWDGVFTFDEK